MDNHTVVWSHRCFFVYPSKRDSRVVCDEVPFSFISHYRKLGYKVYTFQNQRERKNTYIALQTKDHCFKYAEWIYNTQGNPEIWQKVSLKFW